MVKFLAVGDIHYKYGNQHQTDRLEELVLKQMNKVRYDFVILLGDVLHDFAKVNIDVKSRAIRFIQQLGSHTPTYVLVGNHDIVNNQLYLPEAHAFQGVTLPNVFFINKPKRFTIGGHVFVGVPFVPKGRFNEAVTLLGNEALVFAHQEFKGAKLGGTVVSKDGDEWKRDVRVISGHIHRPQELGNVTYAGAAIQTNFGETWDTSIISGIYTEEATHLDYISTVETGRHITYNVEAQALLDGEWPEIRRNEIVRLRITGGRGAIEMVKAHPKIKEYHKVLYVKLKHLKGEMMTPFANEVIFVQEIKSKLDKVTQEHEDILSEFLRSI